MTTESRVYLTRRPSAAESFWQHHQERRAYCDKERRPCIFFVVKKICHSCFEAWKDEKGI